MKVLLFSLVVVFGFASAFPQQNQQGKNELIVKVSLLKPADMVTKFVYFFINFYTKDKLGN